MHHFGSLLLLVVAVTAVAAVARRRSWSAPVLLVVVGLLVSALPGVPRYHLDPEVVLVLLLPPLVYSAAVDGSVTELREDLRAITLLSVGLVLFMTLAVGVVARLVVPGLPLAAGLALGAVLAPTDAVAATAPACWRRAPAAAPGSSTRRRAGRSCCSSCSGRPCARGPARRWAPHHWAGADSSRRWQRQDAWTGPRSAA